MRGRKLVAFLISAMLGFQVAMPIPVALASESEVTISQEAPDLSYIDINFNGEVNEFVLSDTEKINFLGWKDETQKVLVVEYIVIEEEPVTIELPVVQEVAEDTHIGRYRVEEDKEFKATIVKPDVTIEQYLPITSNENGTVIEQLVITDEEGIILERKEEFQYILEELEQRTGISEEEYKELNQPMNEELEQKTEEVEEPIVEFVEEEIQEPVVGEVNVEEEQNVQIDKPIMAMAMRAQLTPSVLYSTHVQSHGWMEEAANGETAGTQGESKRLESIKINTNMDGLGVSYSTHVEKIGWMPEVSNGALSGTVGEAKRLEAIKVNVTGERANEYDIYYRVHAQSYGWLGWAKNGEPAGTEGLAKRLEAIEIILVKKNEAAPGVTENAFVKGNTSVERPSVQSNVSYSSYVEGIGWMESVKNGELSGTNGQAKRIEAIRVGIENIPGVSVRYSTHLQKDGWLDYSNGSGINGLPGQGKRLEAMKLELTGVNASNYDIYYRVHAQRFGWLGWAKNGEPAGTEGYGFRAEAYEVKVVPKGTSFEQGDLAYRVKDNTSVIYSSHVQSIGWLKESKDGQQNGTVNRALRMEALKVSLKNDQYSGGVQYRTHVQSYGWMNPVNDGAISGTTGETKRIEAVEISLTGEMAQQYDIYYRVHSESFGWLGWAKNGMPAGTQNIRKRVENIEIKLVEKGLQGPAVNAEAAFKTALPKPEVKKRVVFVDVGHGGSDPGAQYYGTREKDLNLQIAFKVEKHLKTAGFDVILSRTSDVFIDHKTERSKMANASGADIFISLHNNAMPGNSYVNGIETFWYEYDSNYEPAINGDMHNDPVRLRESQKIANAVQSSLVSATGAFDRGVRRDTFAVLRETKLPSILVEFGFMSNYSELTKLKTNSYQETLAKALSDGVVRYFNN